MTDVVKGLIGSEDINWHDNSAGGTTEQNFNRTASAGGNIAIIRPSAVQIPTRMPANVATGNRPYANDISANADYTVENCLLQTRLHIPHLKNFEHYGGIPNDNTKATHNTTVFNQIISDLPSNGGGIFFNNDIFYLDPVTVSSRDNIMLVGAGRATTISRVALEASDLFTFVDCDNIQFSDLYLDALGATGNAVSYQATAADAQMFKMFNCWVNAGAYGVEVVGTVDASAARYWWVVNCLFSEQATSAIWGSNQSGAKILNNVITNTGAAYGMVLDSGVGANTRRNAQVEIAGNLLESSSSTGIVVQNQATYNRARQRDILIRNNTLANGDIAIDGIDSAVIQSNQALSGRVRWANTASMTDAYDIVMTANQVTGGSIALAVEAGATNVRGVNISNNTLRDATTGGMVLTCSTGLMEQVAISGNIVDNCVSTATTNTVDGIYFNASGGAGQYYGVVVSGNKILTPSSGLRKYRYGVYFDDTGAGGASRGCMVSNNIFAFYGTAHAAIAGTLVAGVFKLSDGNYLEDTTTLQAAE